MMRAGTAMAPAETISAISALCSCACRRARTVLRALHFLALAVDVCTVVIAFHIVTSIVIGGSL
jgi:hypothetical protein